jgi:hypothetical protein
MLRRRLTLAWPIVVCALLISACGSSGSTSSSSSSAAAATSGASSSSSASSSSTGAAANTSSSAPQMGYEGVPLEQGPALAPASSTGTGSVDGITCAPIEQLAYHIHAHLSVFDDGRLYSLPAGIGIPGSSPQMTNYGPVAGPGRCIYWLHTHTSDGVIHIESPTKRIYPLGDFFDEWRQPLSSTQIASLHGPVIAYVNGHQWKKSVRAIPLLPHEDIQLEIGEPAPPIVTINWSATQL